MAKTRCAACAAERTDATCAAVADETVASVCPVAGLVEVRLDEAEAPWCQVPSKTPSTLEPGGGRPRDEKTASRVFGSADAPAAFLEGAAAGVVAAVVIGSGMILN